MALRLKPFKAEHIAQIEGRALEKAGLDSISDGKEFAILYKEKGPAYSIFNGDKVIACAGVIISWQGLGEAWVYASDDIRQNKLSFHRMIKSVLWEIIECMNLRRVQAEVIADNKTARKWIQALGFKYESTMPRFGVNGETYIMYVILR